MTHSYVWPWLICMCDHGSFICVTMTHSYVWPWLIHMCDHDSFICVTMTHLYVWPWLIHMCDHDSFICVTMTHLYVWPWLIYMCDHDSFICVTSYSCVCDEWFIRVWHTCEITSHIWMRSCHSYKHVTAPIWMMNDSYAFDTPHCVNFTLQHTATHCNTLQHTEFYTATHCNTLTRGLIRTCDVTHHGTPPTYTHICMNFMIWFICATWLIHICAMTHSYVWHYAFLNLICDMTHRVLN